MTVAESLITRLQKSLLSKNGGCFRETNKYQCLFWFPTREHSISSLNIMTMATSFLSPQLTLQKTGLYMQLLLCSPHFLVVNSDLVKLIVFVTAKQQQKPKPQSISRPPPPTMKWSQSVCCKCSELQKHNLAKFEGKTLFASFYWSLLSY